MPMAAHAYPWYETLFRRPLIRWVFLPLVLLAIPGPGQAQCPFAVTLQSNGQCLGSASLQVSTGDALTQIVWYNGSSVVSTATASAAGHTGTTIAGGNGYGSNANQFGDPDDLVVDAAGNLYVTDYYNNRVLKFAPGSTNGVTVAGGNQPGGSALNQLNGPMGLFVDKNGNVYVCDNENNRILEFPAGSTAGSNGIVVAGGNGPGTNPNQLTGPIGVFVDATGNIYVGDAGDYRIQKWAPGASSGTTVAGGNGPGSALNQLGDPWYLVVDAAGNLYVSDHAENRVLKFPPGSTGATNGVVVAGGNGAGAAANQLNYPGGLYVDAFGNVYVIDTGNERVQEWLSGATSGITVAGGNGVGSAANQLSDPQGLYVDQHGNIYIADQSNERIQEWPPLNSINTGLTPTVAGTYTAAVTDVNGCTVTTNAIVIDPTTTPSILISQSAGSICSTAPTFTATPTAGGTAPSYQWQVGGINEGSNSAAFTVTTPADGALVTCTMTSNAACPAPAVVTSNTIVLAMQPSATLFSQKNNCLGLDSLLVTSTDTLASILWYDGSTLMYTAMASQPGSGITVAGGNGQGQGANQLNWPSGISFDVHGNLYIADTYNNRVQEWAPGATSGTTVAGQASGIASSNANALGHPDNAVVNASGTLLVSDGGNSRVQAWPPDANTGTTVAGFNGPGPAANQFDDNSYICLDQQGNLYVSDVFNARVQKWSPGATSGVTVAGGNGVGSAANQLDEPSGVFVDSHGDIYVSDLLNNRVQEWLPGATSGITVAGGNGAGSAASQLANPTGLFVDALGNIYVDDPVNNRVQEWAPGASSGVTVAGGNGSGAAANQLNNPNGVYVDASGNVYVSDTYNNRIQEWVRHSSIDTTYKPTATGSYTAVITSKTGCSVTTGPIVFQPVVVPTVVLQASTTMICSGAAASFTATPGQGGAAPNYQWQVDGVAAGANSPLFSSTSLKDGDLVTCTMTSNAQCASPVAVTSNSIPMTVNAVVTPAVSIAAPVTAICSGQPLTFTATPAGGGGNPTYQWQVGGIIAPGSTSNASFTDNNLADGDIISCTMTSDAVCATTSTAISNKIPINVNASATPSLGIAASATTACQGDTVSFVADLSGMVTNPMFQWQVNGADAGGNSPDFKSGALNNGDVVTCQVNANAGCATAASNSVAMTVYSVPQLAQGPAVSLQEGQSATLVPLLTGNTAGYIYSWSPVTGLSDATIEDPVATPSASTVYTLLVTTGEGCKASAGIKVDVFTQLRIPNAFTPNGDGHNDVFYVLGGLQGTVIRRFTVFDRWGQSIFQAQDSQPGDPSRGWNGYCRGAPCPTGAYVYFISVSLADGSLHEYKGTVMLVR